MFFSAKLKANSCFSKIGCLTVNHVRAIGKICEKVIHGVFAASYFSVPRLCPRCG